jgi:hypothetical protein
VHPRCYTVLRTAPDREKRNPLQRESGRLPESRRPVKKRRHQDQRGEAEYEDPLPSDQALERLVEKWAQGDAHYAADQKGVDAGIGRAVRVVLTDVRLDDR